MKNDWNNIDKIKLDNLFDELFDVNRLSTENLELFENARANSQYYGGHWQDYIYATDLFNLKIAFLNDLGYSANDLM
jgi:hypothetical protein